MIALLVDVRFSPKVQYFARSALKCAPGEIKFAFPCAFPFFISLAKRSSRLSDLFKVLDMCTSDELCIDMVQMRMTWELRQLNYSLLDCESLLDMNVLGAGEALVFNRVAPVPKPSACAELSSMVLFDVCPLSAGARLAVSEGPFEQAGGSATPIASGDEADADNFDALPDDMLADVQECLDSVMHAGHVLDEFELEADPLPDRIEEVHQDALDQDVLEDALEAAVVAEVSPVGDVQLALSSQVSSTGYVSSPAGIWSTLGSIGRVTSWPAHKPMLVRSVSMKCYLHPGCTSPAKGRSKVSDQFLLEWLFAGVHEPGAASGRKKELGSLHRALFVTRFAAVNTPAASSSAAASSSGP
jgi:hypothetical protein